MWVEEHTHKFRPFSNLPWCLLSAQSFHVSSLQMCSLKISHEFVTKSITLAYWSCLLYVFICHLEHHLHCQHSWAYVFPPFQIEQLPFDPDSKATSPCSVLPRSARQTSVSAKCVDVGVRVVSGKNTTYCHSTYSSFLNKCATWVVVLLGQFPED